MTILFVLQAEQVFFVFSLIHGFGSIGVWREWLCETFTPSPKWELSVFSLIYAMLTHLM